MKGDIPMTTLSIHPIEYLREHADHTHIMTKLLRLLMLISCTLCLIGAVTYLNTPERDEVTHTYMNAFPAEMPDVVVEPMSGFPVY
jgi:hypothetical protein